MKKKNKTPWDRFTIKLDSIKKSSKKCKNCGHTVLMNQKEKAVCTWCGYFVYNSEREEFKDRLLNEISRLK